MIIAAQQDELLVVTQNDHACFAAELLSLWRRDGLPEHPRREEVLFAAREHDNGWREADAAPRCDAESGRPLDFLTVPQELRREIWRRGVDRFLDRRPYVAVLIAEHAIRLHRSLSEDPDWAPLLKQWRQLQDDLLEAVDAERTAVDRDYRWIALSDLLSLGLCSHWRRTFDEHGYRVEMEPRILRLDPFPLAGATTFRVPCRRIPDRGYAGTVDLGTELAAARWREIEVRIAPAPA